MTFQISEARAGSSARRTAVDSSCAPVTPKAARIESRCRTREVSLEPTGSFRSATIVRTNVESLMSLKTGSRRQAVAINRLPAVSQSILGFNGGRATGDR